MYLLGYEGEGTERTCFNVDECADEIAQCQPNSDCIDTVGSYVCNCIPGYKLNGDVCENIDECALGNDCSQVSKNLCTDSL